MATLNDLEIVSLSNLSQENGLELILAMRLRRRSVPERTKIVRAKKEIPAETSIASLTEAQLADLYYTLMAKRQENLL